MKGKYLYMPDGQVLSIPGDRDRESIVFSIGQKTMRLSSFGPGGKKMYIRGDYDKQFKNVNDVELPIESAAIDTGGHYTHEVYQYVRERSHIGLIGINIDTSTA